MKICPKCNTQIDDDSIFCSICGTSLNGEQPIYTPPVTQFYDPYDHTSEFDAEDISQNKRAIFVYFNNKKAIYKK